MRTAAVYLIAMAVIVWGVWSYDRSNAAKLDRIDKVVTTCGNPAPLYANRHPFYD